MGYSCYLFGCADGNFKPILRLIKKHNRHANSESSEINVGEELVLEAVLFAPDGLYWLLISNGGGRDSTNDFIEDEMNSKKLGRKGYPAKQGDSATGRSYPAKQGDSATGRSYVFYRALQDKPSWYGHPKRCRTLWKNSDGLEVLKEKFSAPVSKPE